MKIDKLKKVFSELPKPVLITIAFIFLLFLSTPLLITLIKPSERKVTPPTPPVREKVQEEKASQQVNSSLSTEIPSSLLEAKAREIELLKKEGKYFSGIESTEKSSPEGSRKVSTADSSFEVTDKLPPPSFSHTPATPHTVTPPKFEEEKEKEKEEPAYIKQARQIWEDVVNAKPAVGKLVSLTNKKSKNEEAKLTESTKASSSQKVFDPRKVLLIGEFYKATIKTTVTSANPQAIVIAQLNEGLKNAKLLGKISGLIGDEYRLNVVFDKLIYEEKVYPISGIAYSLDKTVGVASELKYNVLAKIFTTGTLAFGQAMTEALREDEKTQISTLWGVEVVEKKAENRFREGVLAGTSAAFETAKNKMENYAAQKQDVKVILREGTPIYVIFTEL